MWQRQSSRRPSRDERASAAAAGRGRCTRPSRRESSRAFISLYCAQVAHWSSVRSCGLPCSALDELGRVEELLAPVDHLPLDLEPDVAHERHERVEDLRHAAAESGRGQVHDAPPLQRLGELATSSTRRRRGACSRRGSCVRGRRAGARERGRYREARPISRRRSRGSGRSPSFTRTGALAVARRLHDHGRAGVEQRDRAREVVGILDRAAADRVITSPPVR